MNYLYILAFFLPTMIWGQSNLVPNPNFEDKTSCLPNIPNIVGGGGVSEWYNPNTSSPDYLIECVFPLVNLQSAHSDSAYVGIASYDPNGSNLREYVSCGLLDTLIASNYYWVEFYTSVGELLTSVPSNNLGIYFSDTALQSLTTLYFDVDAQVKYFNNEIIDDTLNWVKVCGLYQALGGEKFITLGNFNTDAETTEGVQYNLGNWQTYFLIDDVSVIPLDSILGGIPVDAGPDKTIYINDSAFIGQKISNMPDIWTELDGTPVASNTAGVYVFPTVNTTYVVTRNLNGFYSTDTVTVFVEGLGLKEDNLYHFTVAPNPSSGNILLEGPVMENFSLEIVSTDGKIVFEKELLMGSSQQMLNTGLSNGSYILKLENEQGKIVFRERVMVR